MGLARSGGTCWFTAGLGGAGGESGCAEQRPQEVAPMARPNRRAGAHVSGFRDSGRANPSPSSGAGGSGLPWLVAPSLHRPGAFSPLSVGWGHFPGCETALQFRATPPLGKLGEGVGVLFLTTACEYTTISN